MILPIKSYSQPKPIAMKKYIPLLITFLFISASIFAQQTKNGWDYEVLKAGNGPTLSRTQAAETHNQLSDSDGKVLASTHSVGVPDYQIISKLSKDFQALSKGNTSLSLPGKYVYWEVQLIRILPAKPGLYAVVKKSIDTDGADAAFKEWKNAISGANPDVYVGEWELNKVGYTFLSKGYTDMAIQVLENNMKAHPKSANAHDSLAEAYYKNGNMDLAGKHYRVSLKLNPDNDNARKMLAKMDE